MFLPVFLIIAILLLIIPYKQYESFMDFKSEYPCRTVLSDEDFLRHMITHHQVAIDISQRHLTNTKNDILMQVLRELIWTQTYEVLMMKEELEHKTENVSIVDDHQPFLPTVSSSIEPNVIGLTKIQCDPSFFSSEIHQHTEHMPTTDKEYILHMIPHHQVAIDMCKIILQHTNSDFLIYLSYRMIRSQEAEVILLHNLLKSRFIQ